MSHSRGEESNEGRPRHSRARGWESWLKVRLLVPQREVSFLEGKKTENVKEIRETHRVSRREKDLLRGHLNSLLANIPRAGRTPLLRLLGLRQGSHMTREITRPTKPKAGPAKLAVSRQGRVTLEREGAVPRRQPLPVGRLVREASLVRTSTSCFPGWA